MYILRTWREEKKSEDFFVNIEKNEGTKCKYHALHFEKRENECLIYSISQL